MRQITTTTLPCKNCGGVTVFVEYEPLTMTLTCVTCRLKQLTEEEE